MTPSDVHKMIAKYDGEWTGDIQMWMDPAGPAQKMSASCTNKMIFDGRYQESVNTGTFNGMPFEGHSLLAYDNLRKVFISTWIDNFGTGVIYMEGTWNAATKSIELKGKAIDPMAGKEVPLRQVLRLVDDNNQVMEQYTMKDGKEYKNMEIKYTRKK